MVVMGRDTYRDTWVRYLGYASEVAELLRPIVALQFVRYAYWVTYGYVVADVMDKSLTKLTNDGRITKVVWATGDAIIWQGLATLIIPRIAIYSIMAYSNMALLNIFTRLHWEKRIWITINIGLISIPIIVRPIDTGVHVFMDMTYRQLFR